jgi:integrase
MTNPNLKLRGHTYYAVYNVPRQHRKTVGKDKLIRSLKTRDVREANRLKHAALGQLKAEADRLLVTASLPHDSAAFMLEAAKDMRRAVEAGSVPEDAAEETWGILMDDYLGKQGRKVGIDPETGYPLLDGAHENKLRVAGEIFRGTAVFLGDTVQDYLKEITPRITTQSLNKKTYQLGEFVKWAGVHRHVASVTRKVAAQYITAKLLPLPRAIRSKQEHVTTLSAFWGWLELKDLASTNVWRRMVGLLKATTRGGTTRQKRPYTPEELGRLIPLLKAGTALLPLVCLGAYAGCRLSELGEMKVEHVTADALRVMKGKTDNSVRYIPLHPVIADMVKKLCKASKDGYLIDGLLRGGQDGKRGYNTGTRLAAILTKHDFAQGELDFHSLRRSFAQRCEQANIPESTAQLLTGHARQSLTYGLYSPGPEFPTLQEAIGKVSYGAEVDALVRSLAATSVVTKRASRRRKPQPKAAAQ